MERRERDRDHERGETDKGREPRPVERSDQIHRQPYREECRRDGIKNEFQREAVEDFWRVHSGAESGFEYAV